MAKAPKLSGRVYPGLVAVLLRELQPKLTQLNTVAELACLDACLDGAPLTA